MKPDEKVFKLKAPCIGNKIRQLAKKAGLGGFHTHTMRHKFATDLLGKGANIREVQELLGHENSAATQVYLSVTDQGLRRAVELLDDQRSNRAKNRAKSRGRDLQGSSLANSGRCVCTGAYKVKYRPFS